MTGDARVDAFLAGQKRWGQELTRLRAIAREFPLQETLKWGQPCYVADNANIVLIHGFKDYCALLFFKGALLDSEHGMLVQQTKNVQAARQMRFTNLSEIEKQKHAVKACILQAMAVERAGVQVPRKTTAEFEVPEELERKLAQLPDLRKAFRALTPGRQRAYLLHFASAKQSKTREARVEKAIDHILAGEGLDD